MKKTLTIALIALLAAAQVFACTIFAVGKDATTDGSTMISHTCDSTGDDFRLWLIPSLEEGYERDIIYNGRKGVDYSTYPDVDYKGGITLGSYTYTKASNQYIHAMYSFMNDKGLAMSESTCWYDSWSTPELAAQGAVLNKFFAQNEGIFDCYMLQDLALETCSTAREAIEFMGAMINEYGWADVNSCENIMVTDGNESWTMEIYGGHTWCAVRVPDNAVAVVANRARINEFDFNDTDRYLCNPTFAQDAKELGLWDGESRFIPCDIYCPRRDTYSCNREWMALKLLDPSLDIDINGNPNTDWPLYVVPQEKVSVETIRSLCSNYFQGTDLDVTKLVGAGPFGNPLNPIFNSNNRTINSYRCTYIQIANVKAWLPAEARCLTWFGWGAPDSTYLTPIFASMTELAPHFSIGTRAEFDAESGWWNASHVQQLATINYQSAIQDIYAVRDPKLQQLYKTTAAAQELAASMIEAGQTELAVKYLTSFANTTAKDWFKTWKELGDVLEAKYMHGNVNMSTPKRDAEWTAIEQTSVYN